VFPGKTLAAAYFASYEGESALVYHEFAIAVALVWHVGRPHAWAPHIYVDNAASLAGGRSIWGLTKSLATFERSRSSACDSVDVRSDGRLVCSIAVSGGGSGFPLWAPVPAIGISDVPVSFTARLRASARLAKVEVSLPMDSPYRRAVGRQAFAALRFDELDLVVPGPRALKCLRACVSKSTELQRIGGCAPRGRIIEDTP